MSAILIPIRGGPDAYARDIDHTRPTLPLRLFSARYAVHSSDNTELNPPTGRSVSPFNASPRGTPSGARSNWLVHCSAVLVTGIKHLQVSSLRACQYTLSPKPPHRAVPPQEEKAFWVPFKVGLHALGDPHHQRVDGEGGHASRLKQMGRESKCAQLQPDRHSRPSVL